MIAQFFSNNYIKIYKMIYYRDEEIEKQSRNIMNEPELGDEITTSAF